MVPGVPFSLVPSSAGLWRVDAAVGVVTVSAQPHTDIFIDPGGGSADAGAAVNADVTRQDRLRGPVADRRRMQRDLRRDPITAEIGEALGQESDLVEGHSAPVAGRRLALEADLVA